VLGVEFTLHGTGCRLRSRHVEPMPAMMFKAFAAALLND
jgi:hypothetical protein